MLLAVNLEIHEENPAPPEAAVATATRLLGELPIRGQPIVALPNAASPVPGTVWRPGQMLPLGHPELPDSPMATTMTYVRQGSRSRGGYRLRANVPHDAPERGVEFAETLSELARAWIARRPCALVTIFGFPDGPPASDLRGSGLPASLGWVTWLDRTIWPGLSSIEPAPFFRAEELGTGSWLQLTERFGDVPAEALTRATAGTLRLLPGAVLSK